MEIEVKELTPAGLADAFALIERHDFDVATVHGPVDLLAQMLGGHANLVTEKDTIWGAQIVRDNDLCAVFVCD